VTAEEKVNRYGYHYTYYRCTKKRFNPKCSQRSIDVAKLEKTILGFLNEISISDKIHTWALAKLDKAFAKRRDTVEANRLSLEKACETTSRELENLTKLRIRDLISDKEFVTQRERLDLEQMKTRQNLEKLGQASSWLEPAHFFISFSNRAISWFNEGDSEIKRLILEVAGSNLILKDKKLFIEAAKPFRRGSKGSSFSQLCPLVEDVRTFVDDPAFEDKAHKLKMLFELVEKKQALQAAFKSAA